MAGFFCTIPILSALMASCAPPPPDATGHVEGEFVLVAPVATARLETLAVRRGGRVEQGQTLAMQERRDAEIALAGAASALAQAESRLADLQEGRREEENRVIEAELASARARA
jgi:HlyD family secretion protein